jgi:hypothetical protein
MHAQQSLNLYGIPRCATRVDLKVEHITREQERSILISNLDLDKRSVHVRIPSACYDVGPPDLGPESLSKVPGHLSQGLHDNPVNGYSDHCVMLSDAFNCKSGPKAWDGRRDADDGR